MDTRKPCQIAQIAQVDKSHKQRLDEAIIPSIALAIGSINTIEEELNKLSTAHEHRRINIVLTTYWTTFPNFHNESDRYVTGTWLLTAAPTNGAYPGLAAHCFAGTPNENSEQRLSTPFRSSASPDTFHNSRVYS
jgi:hypothetical protein